MGSPAFVDGILQQWGERYDWSPQFKKPKLKQSRVTLIPVARAAVASPAAAVRAKASISAVAKRVPECVVKVTGGARSMTGVARSIAYISRLGVKDKDLVSIKDQDGNVHAGADEIEEAVFAFVNEGYPIDTMSQDRQTYSVMLSMPPGTDRVVVARAAEDFARKTFKGHQYLIAHHVDEAHPHAHIVVKKQGISTRKPITTKKADLYRWRTYFAYALKQHGVEANATRAKARGRVGEGRNWKKSKYPEMDMSKRKSMSTQQRVVMEMDYGLVLDSLAASAQGVDWKMAIALENQQAGISSIDEGNNKGVFDERRASRNRASERRSGGAIQKPGGIYARPQMGATHGGNLRRVPGVDVARDIRRGPMLLQDYPHTGVGKHGSRVLHSAVRHDPARSGRSR